MHQSTEHDDFGECMQVVDAKTVVDKPGGRAGSPPSRVAECLVGDETGVIVFSAKNEQGQHLRRHGCCTQAQLRLSTGCLCMQSTSQSLESILCFVMLAQTCSEDPCGWL